MLESVLQINILYAVKRLHDLKLRFLTIFLYTYLQTW